MVSEKERRNEEMKEGVEDKKKWRIVKTGQEQHEEKVGASGNITKQNWLKPS